MWEMLAQAGIPYTRPQGTPPRTRAGMRRFLDPRQRLEGVHIEGARVLALAAGGGWHAVLFAELGADTTLFDISERQLQTVRELAESEGVALRFEQGDMKDLSRFHDGTFDVVWHAHSLTFVDDAQKVLLEVGRVLAPRGTYVMSTNHPTSLRLRGTWDGHGWSPRRPYSDDSAVPSSDWTYDGRVVAGPTLEYGHRIETIVNGLAAAGMIVDGLWELNEHHPPPNPELGSDEHLDTLFPNTLEVRARKLTH